MGSWNISSYSGSKRVICGAVSCGKIVRVVVVSGNKVTWNEQRIESRL